MPATITGTIINLNAARAQTAIDFQYLSSPAVVSGSGVDPSPRRIFTNGIGQFSIVLPMGDYFMIVAGLAIYKISVPDDNQTYDFTSRIIGAVTQSPTNPLAVLGLWLKQNITELRSVPGTSANRLAVLYSPTEADKQFFRWDAASAVADNGSTVIKPTDIESGSPGRWLWMDHGYGSGGVGTNSIIGVATRAALKAIPSTSSLRFAIIGNPEVAGLATGYTFIFGDTTTADDINVIAPNDGLGRYFAKFY